MTNQGDNEKWPPEPWPPEEWKPMVLPEEKQEKQQFDGISKLITYVVGFGLALTILALFVRLALWIIGVDL